MKTFAIIKDYNISDEIIKDFFIERDEHSIIIGGIKGKNLPDDGKKKEVRISGDNFYIFLQKGRRHDWTKFSEDCLLAYWCSNFFTFAVFDGISGDCDGSGGIASRQAAELLRNRLPTVNKKNCGDVMISFRKEALLKLKEATTALIVFVFGKKAIVFNKGDCCCFLGEQLVNKIHGHGPVVTSYLNDTQAFDRVEFTLGEELGLTSDGIEHPEYDDIAVIRYKI